MAGGRSTLPPVGAASVVLDVVDVVDVVEEDGVAGEDDEDEVDDDEVDEGSTFSTGIFLSMDDGLVCSS